MGKRYVDAGRGILDSVSGQWLSAEEAGKIHPDDIKAAKPMGDFLISPDGVVRVGEKAKQDQMGM